MINYIYIKNKKIGKNEPIFLIAEVGVNHNGKLTNAKKLIDIAVEAKVDAIKFQTFRTDNMILKTTPKVDYQIKNTDNQETFYEMLKKYELSDKDFLEINNHCIKRGIIFLSTPFDETSVQLLEKLNIPAYKIGSGDMNNFPLLKLICSNKKPILLSTGMATLEEVKKSVEFIQNNGINEIVIFQCTTNYPANYEELNLNVIDTFKKEFPNTIIGFSDHSIGIEASLGAVAKGVKVIEKHFTVDKKLEGPDHQASLEPNELSKWVESIRNIEKALGSFEKIPSSNERKILLIARKFAVSTKDIKIGDTLTLNNIAFKRTGCEGIAPSFFEEILNTKVKRFISKNSIIKWEDLDIE